MWCIPIPAMRMLSRPALRSSSTGRGMEDMILRIEVPMETVKEVNGQQKAKEVERKIFPGYVLVKMVMTDDTWHLVRNVRGVTGFVGQVPTKAIPSRRRRFWPWAWKSMRSWSDTMWATM